jgi:hypothetical protein
MRAVTGPDGGARPRLASRWVWGLSGLVVAAALAVPGTRLLALGGVPWHQPPPLRVATSRLAVPPPVTGVIVHSYGGQVQVTAGPVSRVQATARISYAQQDGAPPALTESVSGGRLSLGDPACQNADCFADFTVTVPAGTTVTVDTEGGPATVTAVVAATVNSGGGLARITQVSGPLTVSTGGGPLMLNQVTGPLRADTSGGSLVARGINSATASISTGGGPAQVTFAAAPRTVRLYTDGGPAMLRVPGGPYALTADSDGGPELIEIATDPAARPSIHISSGGGPLQIAPAPRTR